MQPERPITTRGFDMEAGEIGRIFRTYSVNRFIPLGFFAGFTRLRQLAVLLLIHGCGRFLFLWLIPYEAWLTRLYAGLKRRRGRRAA